MPWKTPVHVKQMNQRLHLIQRHLHRSFDEHVSGRYTSWNGTGELLVRVIGFYRQSIRFCVVSPFCKIYLGCNTKHNKLFYSQIMHASQIHHNHQWSIPFTKHQCCWSSLLTRVMQSHVAVIFPAFSQGKNLEFGQGVADNFPTLRKREPGCCQ